MKHQLFRIKNCQDMIKNLLIFSLIIITLTSCEKPSDCTNFYFSDELKSYVSSTPGSYWIFEDKEFGLVDSIYLISQSIDFYDKCSTSTQPQEKIKQEVSSSFHKYNDENVLKIGADAETGNYSGNNILGEYSEKNGAFLDSLEVNGIWYKDVTETTFKYSLNKYYHAKDIGLIRKEFQRTRDNDTIYHFDIVKYFKNTL